MNNNNSVDTKPYYISEIPINGTEAYDLLQIVNKTFLSKSYDLSQSWKLKKVISIRNHIFEYEFKDKSIELEQKSSFPAHWEVRYGFLATIKEKMIEKVACEGLEVKMCPYNYLGYNIAGVHISQHADVCLTEAKSKIVAGDELILIVFQYMLGNRKFVDMHDPKVLLAPTPKFDSHICEERPDPKEKDSLQYIKSLVYLYEFGNGNLDPVIRPRHCCPVAALIFKNIPSYESLDSVGSDTTNMFFSSYQSPLSLLKPVSQHVPTNFIGRQYPPSEVKKSSIVLQKNEDSRKMAVNSKEKELYDIENPTTVEETFRPVSYGHHYPNEASREDHYNSQRGINGDSNLLKSVDRDRSPDLLKKWNESESRSSSRSTRGFESSRRISSRTSNSWFN